VTVRRHLPRACALEHGEPYRVAFPVIVPGTPGVKETPSALPGWRMSQIRAVVCLACRAVAFEDRIDEATARRLTTSVKSMELPPPRY
jgi:hypothetical protein